MASQSRRGFMGSFFFALGGAAVAMSPLTLVGCAGEAEEGAHDELGPAPQTMAVETVKLRPGVHYNNVMPTRVAPVRLLPNQKLMAATL